MSEKLENRMEELVVVMEAAVRAMGKEKAPPQVTVNVPEQRTPVFQMDAPQVHVKAPEVNVQPAPPAEVIVNVPEGPLPPGPCAYTVEVTERGAGGLIRKLTIRPDKA